MTTVSAEHEARDAQAKAKVKATSSAATTSTLTPFFATGAERTK